MRSNLLLFIGVLLFSLNCGAQIKTFVGPGTDWNTASNWSPAGVPSNDISGTIIINANVVVVSSITVKNGGNLTVNSPYTLTVGVVGNSATTQVVDFQNGCFFNLNSGASLVVYGLMNNSNNSTGVVFDGSVNVTGNVTAGNGSIIAGSGTLSSTGTIISGGDGQIFGSTGNCGTGPCNQSNLCSFTSSVASNQTVCSNVIPSTLTSSTNATSPSYQWQSSTVSGGGFADIPQATSSTYSFPGTLNQTTYYRLKIKTDNCTSTTSPVVITVLGSSTWTGSYNTDWFDSRNWGCGGIPTSSTDVVIPNTPNKPIINGAANCKSLTLNANASLSVNTGTLTVENGITVNATAALTFENNTSLVQTNDSAINSGNITYKRTTPGLKPYDYLYWSSPVSVTFNGAGVPLSQLATNSLFYSFSPTLDNWVSASDTTQMNVGVGYLGRASSSLITGTKLTTSFYGVPNNGIKTISVTGTSANPRSYLLGNPYPSALDADTFLRTNSTVLSGTLYFWTHNTQISSTSGLYEGDDYAVYNLTGGTIDEVNYNAGGTSAPSVPIGLAPTRYIASGQGFFATSVGTGNVVFNDDMRGANNNSQFYKTKAATVEEKSRIWIDLYDNVNGLFKQALIGYVAGATNEYDDSYDGESLDANPSIDFYSVIQDKNLVIQGRPLPFDNEDIVPLGYRAAIAGDLNISILQTDGLFLDQEVFIEDKLLNIIHNLKEGAYHFITEEGTFDDRFVLRYTNKLLGTNKLNDTKGLAFVSNKKLEVQTSADIKQIDLYDISGKLIKTYLPTLVSNTFENEFDYSKGVYVIKVKTDNDMTFIEKLMN